MAEVKIVINDVKSGKSYQKVGELEDFIGKKMGEKVDGSSIGLEGYELQISGGSDDAGFPMRGDVGGSIRKKGLFKGGVGVTTKRHGQMIRKSVRGNTVSEMAAQINLKITKYGSQNVEDCLGIKKDEKKEEPKEEKKEEVKEEKKEEVKEEKKEKPKEEKKEEVKEEKKEKPKEEPKEEKPAAEEKKEEKKKEG